MSKTLAGLIALFFGILFTCGYLFGMIYNIQLTETFPFLQFSIVPNIVRWIALLAISMGMTSFVWDLYSSTIIKRRGTEAPTDLVYLETLTALRIKPMTKEDIVNLFRLPNDVAEETLRVLMKRNLIVKKGDFYSYPVVFTKEE